MLIILLPLLFVFFVFYNKSLFFLRAVGGFCLEEWVGFLACWLLKEGVHVELIDWLCCGSSAWWSASVVELSLCLGAV